MGGAASGVAAFTVETELGRYSGNDPGRGPFVLDVLTPETELHPGSPIKLAPPSSSGLSTTTTPPSVVPWNLKSTLGKS